MAGSKRGRDLRAAAALARFDQQKKSEDEEDKTRVKAVEELASDDNDFDTASEDESGESGAADINCKQLLNSKGHRIVKVCEDEKPEDGDAQNKLQKLQSSMNVTAAMAQSSIAKSIMAPDEYHPVLQQKRPPMIEKLPIECTFYSSITMLILKLIVTSNSTRST